jgi:hypothetical protein
LRIDIHEYRYKLKLFTDYYNHQKPHSGLGMFGMTPAERIGYSLIQNSLAYAREFELSFDDVWGLKSFLNVNLTLQFNNIRVFWAIFNRVFENIECQAHIIAVSEKIP